MTATDRDCHPRLAPCAVGCEPGRRFDPARHCYRCWAFLHDPAKRAVWGGDPAGVVPVKAAPKPPKPARRQVLAVGPQGGMGTELAALLGGLGLSSCKSGCGDRAAEMDRLGPDWCRANRATIEGWLRAAGAKTGVGDKMKAAVLGVAAGLAFRLNPLDPYPGLVDELFRRWDAKRLAGHFNPGLVGWGGGLVLVSRKGRTNSRLYVTRLADDLTPAADPALLRIDHPLAAVGQEDARFFVFDGRPHLGFAGVSMGGGKVSQLVAELTPDLAVARVWAPQLPYPDRPMQKNHVYFPGDDGVLRSVYTTGPEHVVLSHDGKTREEARVPSFPWRHGEARGGATPVRVGDEWFHWFHGTERQAAGWNYVAGLYTFDAKPPFRPRRYVPEPILVTAVQNDERKRVIFPCGAVRRGDEWVVSYGFNDAEVRFARFGAADIESRLVGV